MSPLARSMPICKIRANPRNPEHVKHCGRHFENFQKNLKNKILKNNFKDLKTAFKSGESKFGFCFQKTSKNIIKLFDKVLNYT